MKNIIIGDGALGTELRDRGIELPSHTESIWSALALTEHPDEIKQIHLDYIEAGSDFITINNYAGRCSRWNNRLLYSHAFFRIFRNLQFKQRFIFRYSSNLSMCGVVWL